jgi:hypothetical protein
MAICVPGLINTIEPTVEIPTGFKRIYDLNWFINTLGALVAYWAICTVFPDKHSVVSMTISEVINGASNDDSENSERGLDMVTESYEIKSGAAKL